MRCLPTLPAYSRRSRSCRGIRPIIRGRSLVRDLAFNSVNHKRNFKDVCSETEKRKGPNRDHSPTFTGFTLDLVSWWLSPLPLLCGFLANLQLVCSIQLLWWVAGRLEVGAQLRTQVQIQRDDGRAPSTLRYYRSRPCPPKYWRLGLLAVATNRDLWGKYIGSALSR